VGGAALLGVRCHARGMLRRNLLGIAAVVIALSGIVFALVWPGTCRSLQPLGPATLDQLRSRVVTLCVPHYPLRIGIAIAGVMIGATLAAIASRRDVSRRRSPMR
jgi:hypothetical protein